MFGNRGGESEAEGSASLLLGGWTPLGPETLTIHVICYLSTEIRWLVPRVCVGQPLVTQLTVLSLANLQKILVYNDI